MPCLFSIVAAESAFIEEGMRAASYAPVPLQAFQLQPFADCG
jgi:hypothetical protein